MADTGGRRNEKPLTEEQKREIKGYAVSLGVPEYKIHFLEYDITGYGPELDVLKIGTDVLPVGERVKSANSNVSLKGTVAHEVVGHREANLGGFAQENILLEEVQASIRAARFAPDLNRQERMDLLRDAVQRLRDNNMSLRLIKDKLHIKER
jgi:hypothetical protein